MVCFVRFCVTFGKQERSRVEALRLKCQAEANGADQPRSVDSSSGVGFWQARAADSATATTGAPDAPAHTPGIVTNVAVFGREAHAACPQLTFSFCAQGTGRRRVRDVPESFVGFGSVGKDDGGTDVDSRKDERKRRDPVQMLYIQMEFCPRTLRQVLDAGPLEDEDAWQVK